MPVRKIRQKKNYLLPEMRNLLLYGQYDLESEGGFEAFLIEPDREEIKKVWLESRDRLLAFWPYAVLPYAEAITKNEICDRGMLKGLYENSNK